MKDIELFEALRSDLESERCIAVNYLQKNCYSDLSKMFTLHNITEEAGNVAIEKVRAIFPQEMTELRKAPPVKDWYKRSVFTQVLMAEFDQKDKNSELANLEAKLEKIFLKSDAEIADFCVKIESAAKAELSFVKERLKPELRKIDLDDFLAKLAIEIKRGEKKFLRRKVYRYFLKKWLLTLLDCTMKELYKI